MKDTHVDIKIYQILLILIGGVFLFIRAPYGYCFNDEPFIVTLGQRLSYGDSLIVDEWNLAQLFSPVMMYFYKFYHLFFPSNEGILLFFRYIYCILWLITSCIIYKTIRNECRYSIFVFLYLVLFAPFDYMTLSYKSFGLICGLSISALVYSAANKKIPDTITVVMLSLFISLFAISCPYMGVLAILIGVVLLIYNHLSCLSGRCVIWNNKYIIACFLITFILALYYLLFFVFRNNDVQKILKSIPFLFKGVEHAGGGKQKIEYIYIVLYYLAAKCKLYTIILMISFILTVFRNRLHIGRLPIFIVACLGFLISVALFVHNGFKGTFNHEVLDISLLGIIAFMLLDNKPWTIFYSFTCIGFAYILVDSFLSSNTHLFEFAMDALIIGVSSIIYIIKLCEELKDEHSPISRYGISFICIIILTLQIVLQIYTRMERQFFDVSPLQACARIELGACKGLRTSLENKTNYEDNYIKLTKMLDIVRPTEQKIFLSFSANPVLYLDAEMPFGSFSSWTFGYDEKVWEKSLNKRLTDYYNLNPDKIPDVIFAESRDDVIWGLTDGYKTYELEGSYLFVAN